MKTTTRTIVHISLSAMLIFLGWTVGRAQTSEPNFEFVVNAPGGETTVECVRGCKLAWVERGVNPDSTPMATFKYFCGAPRCSSGRVGGWVNQ